MDLYGFSSVIIGVHASTDDTDLQIKDEFHKKLTEALKSFKPNQEVFLAGDLNARVGIDDDSPVIGCFGEDIKNNSDDYLVVAELVCAFQNSLPLQTQTEKNKIEIKRYRVRHSQNDNVRDMYKKRLTLELANLNEYQGVEKEYENIKKAIHTAAEGVKGGEPSKILEKNLFG
ncbi:hypothetical protein HHI36_009773 [Cryptolaemus montrouzieri]|uniref:Craniofacial development protein 2-like n=1 Tax=Cryptolaemus montrouzieri TaxID=559131 RepID=A0ABD2MGU1_9CUCU